MGYLKMPKQIDLTGQYFGHLKVIERSANTKDGKAAWLCECKCGTRKVIAAHNLRNGATISCGCMRAERLRMPKFTDLTDKKFNFMRVIEYSGNTKHGEAAWLCECKCGTRKIIPGSKLRNGTTKSCGCMKRELCGVKNRTHGMKGTRLYNIWSKMIQRTTNQNDNEYGDYGGRGIGICEEWRNSFEFFMKWSYENGYADNLTIDRKDNNKGYQPDNCRWVTNKENCRNKRNNHCLTYNGQTKTITEWAEITGLGKEVIRYRIVKMGWSAEKALTTPKMKNKRQP